MKKTIVSAFALALLTIPALNALEKPATPDVDIDTLRIEKMLAESKGQAANPDKIAQLKALLVDLKEKAKAKTTEELQKLNRLMTDLELAIKSKVQ